MKRSKKYARKITFHAYIGPDVVTTQSVTTWSHSPLELMLRIMLVPALELLLTPLLLTCRDCREFSTVNTPSLLVVTAMAQGFMQSTGADQLRKQLF